MTSIANNKVAAELNKIIQGNKMCEREKFYIEKFGDEYIVLKQACQIWRKPGYSTLSKKLPEIGYQTAVNKGIIPIYKKEGISYLFKIKDILNFLDAKEGINGK